MTRRSSDRSAGAPPGLPIRYQHSDPAYGRAVRAVDTTGTRRRPPARSRGLGMRARAGGFLGGELPEVRQ